MTQNMSALRVKFREKVVRLLDSIEFDMRSQLHLTNPSSIIDELDSLDNLWSVMTEDEREFISAVRYAIDNKKKWEY